MTKLEIAEAALEHAYLGKMVTYIPPVKSPVYGRVCGIALDTSKVPHKIILMFVDYRFEIEASEFPSLVKIL